MSTAVLHQHYHHPLRSRNSYFRGSLRSPNLFCSPRLEAVRRLANSFLPTCIKSEHTVICYMADLFCAMQWHSRRPVIQKKRAETESREEIERFRRRTVCPLAPTFSFVFFLVSLCVKDETSLTAVQF